jgi:hypothetical protein
MPRYVGESREVQIYPLDNSVSHTLQLASLATCVELAPLEFCFFKC